MKMTLCYGDLVLLLAVVVALVPAFGGWLVMELSGRRNSRSVRDKVWRKFRIFLATAQHHVQHLSRMYRCCVGVADVLVKNPIQIIFPRRKTWVSRDEPLRFIGSQRKQVTDAWTLSHVFLLDRHKCIAEKTPGTAETLRLVITICINFHCLQLISSNKENE